MNKLTPSTTLEILLSRFQGKLLLEVKDLSSILGLHENSIRNQISQSRFPIHTFLQGTRRVCHLKDVVSYIESISSPSKRRGPRTAAEKIAAAKVAEVNHA